MTAFRYVLSSGPLGFPLRARAFDWMLLNDGDTTQRYRVTVFNAGVGIPKQPAAPGPVEGTLEPGTLTHNANDIGPGKPFPGLPVEVVVEVDDLRMLPSVDVWSTNGGEVVPGTHVAPAQFVRVD